MTEKYGFIYLWFDRLHKRYYVGSHWGTEHDTYICSSRWMRKAFKRRPEDFKRRIIKRISERKDIFIEEQRYLNMIKPAEISPNTEKPRYYNITLTVGNPWYDHPERIKTVGEKISIKKKGKIPKWKDPLERGRNISAAKKKAFERELLETGTAFSDEHRLKIAAALTGTTQSQETSIKKSNALKLAYSQGRRKPSTYIHSEETKKKISEANSGKTISENQKNMIAISNSKEYTIERFDGTTEVIHGLKAYAVTSGIPYVTLYKSSQNQTPIKKYGIKSITVKSFDRAPA